MNPIIVNGIPINDCVGFCNKLNFKEKYNSYLYQIGPREPQSEYVLLQDGTYYEIQKEEKIDKEKNNFTRYWVRDKNGRPMYQETMYPAEAPPKYLFGNKNILLPPTADVLNIRQRKNQYDIKEIWKHPPYKKFIIEGEKEMKKYNKWVEEHFALNDERIVKQVAHD